MMNVSSETSHMQKHLFPVSLETSDLSKFLYLFLTF